MTERASLLCGTRCASDRDASMFFGRWALLTVLLFTACKSSSGAGDAGATDARMDVGVDAPRARDVASDAAGPKDTDAVPEADAGSDAPAHVDALWAGDDGDEQDPELDVPAPDGLTDGDGGLAGDVATEFDIPAGPDTGDPDVAGPDAAEPDAAEPDAVGEPEPDIGGPDILGGADAVGEDSAGTDAAEPDTAEPDSVEPGADAAGPDGAAESELDSAEPDTAEPDIAAEPESEPDVADPEPDLVAEPEPDTATEPDTSEPDGADADGGPLGDLVGPVFGGVVSAEAVSMTEVLLTWGAAEDDVTWPEDIVYEVCISDKRVAKGACVPWVVGDVSAPGVVEQLVEGLEENTRYFFVVRARDEAGNLDDNLVEATALTPGNHAAKAVTVGGGHACALMARGTVRCWGDNGFGQLGDGTTDSRDVAAPVVGLELVKLVAAGTEHTCAAIADGTARCWGRNDRGQLGDGTTDDSTVPVVVADLGFVKALSAGDGHTCAILGDGRMRCWGANDRGQLGDGTYEDRLEPVEVSGAVYVKDAACGAEHTCAVAADGLVACWGRGDSGQLGHGDFEDRSGWTTVEALERMTEVAAGVGHTCARHGDGTVSCWGANLEGQVGSAESAEVEPLPMLVPGVDRVSAIDAGESLSCARIGDGTLRCWGDGLAVEEVEGFEGVDGFDVGDGVCVRNGRGEILCGAPADGLPTVVGGLVAFAGPIDLLSADSSSCAVMSDGAARCWGSNLSNDLGNWSVEGKWAPPSGFAVDVANVEGGVRGAGRFGVTCVLTTQGEPWCWGPYAHGVSTGGLYTPRRWLEFGDVVGLAGRYTDPYVMCAGQSTGDLWCWTEHGVPIVGAHDVIGVSGFRRFWSADGRVYRWETPGVVSEAAGLEAGIDRVIYVEAVGGVNAVRGDGTLWTWDFTLPLNPSGLWKIATPTKLGGFSMTTAVVSAGREAIVGLRANGRLQAWGDNWIRIGSPTETATFNYKKDPAVLDLAVDIDFIENAIDVSLEPTFYSANCVLIADGRVQCWSGVYDEVTAKRVTLYSPRDIRYLP